MSDRDQARALFRAFHKRDPKAGELMVLVTPRTEPTVLEVGTLVSIGYKATGNGETYYHEFEAKRPKLFVTPSGIQAFIVGGSYRFTDRGFLK